MRIAAVFLFWLASQFCAAHDVAELASHYSGKVVWDKASGTLTFTS